MRRSSFISNLSVQTMRILLLALALAFLVAVASARDVSAELSQAPNSAVAAPFMSLLWVANQTAVDAGVGLFHQPWPPNVALPLNVTVTRYVLPVPWRLLFARAVPVDVSNPTGAAALYINVYITMDTASLISQGLMRSDCRDVVATTEWGDPLPTWVDNCNTAASRVWVMIPVLPPGTWRIWLHHGCPNCQFAADPRAVFLYYEDMQTPPKGILVGTAQYDATNKYVVLTPVKTGAKGLLFYRVPPAQPSVLYVRFKFYIDSCGAAPDNVGEGLWFGVWDTDTWLTTADPRAWPSEDVVFGGYHLTADEGQSRVCFTKSTTLDGPCIASASVSISQSAWHTYEGYMWHNGTAMSAIIYYDGQKLVDAADAQPQQNAVNGLGVLEFGARTSSVKYCRHLLGPLLVAHLDPRIAASAGQPVSPPPLLAPPRVGLVTYRIYINSTHALVNGSATPGVLAAPFTYTLHTATASLDIKAGSGAFCMFNASGVASGCQATGVLLRGVGAAYYDPMAWSAPFYNATFIVYGQQAVSLGFSGMWTPGDSYRGWVSVWQWGGVWLNVTQVGGHGAAAPGSRVSATAGTYAVVYSGDGRCTFYVNGTAYSSATCNAPSGTPKLLTPVGPPGVRMALQTAWVAAEAAPTPTESAVFFDMRFTPITTSLGVLQTQLPGVKLGARPSGGMFPAYLPAAYATSQSAWGPFGEICAGEYGGRRYIFGVRYVWLSDNSSTCVLPLPSAPSTASPTLYDFGRYPPVLPWQHPVFINSVPRSERWVVDYGAPYVNVSSAFNVVQALGRTGYVYVFSRFGVAIIDDVTYVAPMRCCVSVQARGALMPGVTVVANNNYYNAWVTTDPEWHVEDPQWYVGPLSSPPSSVEQAIAAVYVETDGDAVAYTWLSSASNFDYKTSGYGRGVIPIFVYTSNLLSATAKVDLAVYGRYAFLVRRDDVHVYSFATELGGSRLDVPIKVPYSGFYTIDVFYNGTKIHSGVYWLDQGGAVYLGVLGPPLSLVPIQPVAATPIYPGPMQPLEWLPRSLPLPAAVSSNPIEVSAAAALAVALAAAYVTYSSSRRLELGLAAAIVAFFATVSLLLPADYRWMVSGWVAFLVTAAMLLIVYYMTR